MLTQTEVPVDVSRTAPNQYGRIAIGPSTPNLRLEVVGLSAGKTPGLPAVVSEQASPFGSNNWTAALVPLTGAKGNNYLTDLVIASDSTGTEAIGLGNDGNIYLAGAQANAQWTKGPGLFSQTPTFLPGTLSAQSINTATVFALSSGKLPFVALYRDQQAQPQWQAGYALPCSIVGTFQQLLARPDLSDSGATHAIGLTSDGRACEVAVASGPGVGAANWKAGQGILGSASGLPVFTQLLAVSGDAAGNFHVIGLGADGSVWDIDRYSATAKTPAWSKSSTLVVAAGTIGGSKIDCYTGSGLSLDLVAWLSGKLTIFARLTNTWASASTVIPTCGVSRHWHIASNLANPDGSLFVIGLAPTGLVYQLAFRSSAGAWSAGAQVPINK